jgi:hypothetical protein
LSRSRRRPSHGEIGGHAREQLARRERLDQVVVRAGIESLHARFLSGPGRQKHHRDIAELHIGADRAQQTEAVEAWHHHVGQDQVGRLLVRGAQRRLAVGGELDLVAALLQQAAHVAPQVGIVVDLQDASRHGFGPRTSGSQRIASST